MNRRLVSAFCLLVGLTGARAALAAPLSVDEIDTDARTVTYYRCANQPNPVRVAYWLAHNGQSFALLTVDGKPTLFVDTVSGSGARYQAGRYVWWTKGPSGNLTDQIAEPSAPPLLADCNEIRLKRKPR